MRVRSILCHQKSRIFGNHDALESPTRWESIGSSPILSTVPRSNHPHSQFGDSCRNVDFLVIIDAHRLEKLHAYVSANPNQNKNDVLFGLLYLGSSRFLNTKCVSSRMRHYLNLHRMARTRSCMICEWPAGRSSRRITQTRRLVFIGRSQQAA